MKKYLSKSVEETERIGEEFAKGLKPGDVVAMYGGLGAGKTAFVRGMAKHLCPDVLVTSPTFTIMLEYTGKYRVCHFDMYRISTFDDLYNIGYFDCIDSDAVCIIEWSENIPFGLPDRYIKLTINALEDESREITAEEIK